MLRNTMILRPYVRPLKRVPNITLHVLAYAGLVLFSLIYGYFITILPPELLFIPATPIGILIALILWVLPDTGSVPKSISAGLLGFFLASNYLWPSYVALNLPGLPWINPQRAALLLLLIYALYGYATSSRLRQETMEVVRSDKWIWKSFVIFWFATVIALPFAGSGITFSLNKWANNQVYWTFLFFITAYVIRKPGSMLTMARALMIAGLVTALISYPEFINRKVPWIDYVPPFLVGDDLIFERVRSDQARLNFDMYRARSSFTVSLSFAEFLSVVLPFFIHAFAEEKALLKKIIFFAAIICLAWSMAMLTGARSGTNGLIIGVFGYLGFWTIRRWQMYKNDLIGPAAVLAFPAAVAAFTALALVWNRLKVMVFGGGQHSFSNAAREAQWDIAIGKLMQNPIGYGAGQTGGVIGYTNPAGELTVDSYYINLLMDSGLVGFLAFMSFVVGTIVLGIRTALLSRDKEFLLAAPAAIGLTALLVIKSVLSQPENLPLLFTYAGAIVALAYRAKRAAATQPPSFQASPSTEYKMVRA